MIRKEIGNVTFRIARKCNVSVNYPRWSIQGKKVVLGEPSILLPTLRYVSFELMIASIRKRYKLQERLPEQTAEAEKPAEKAVEEAVEKAVEEPVKKPRARKPKTENATQEKPEAKRTRTKKTEKKEA